MSSNNPDHLHTDAWPIDPDGLENDLVADAIDGRVRITSRFAARAVAGENLTSRDQRVVTAEHEAAHVVAYIVTGCGFHYAEAFPNRFTMSAPWPVERDNYTLAVVNMAGQVVEDSALDCLGQPLIPLAERVAEAVELVESGDMTPEDLGDWGPVSLQPKIVERAYAQAAAILGRHADAHAEIADFLIAHGSLDREQLLALPLASALFEQHCLDEGYSQAIPAARHTATTSMRPWET